MVVQMDKMTHSLTLCILLKECMSLFIRPWSMLFVSVCSGYKHKNFVRKLYTHNQIALSQMIKALCLCIYPILKTRVHDTLEKQYIYYVLWMSALGPLHTAPWWYLMDDSSVSKSDLWFNIGHKWFLRWIAVCRHRRTPSPSSSSSSADFYRAAKRKVNHKPNFGNVWLLFHIFRLFRSFVSVFQYIFILVVLDVDLLIYIQAITLFTRA